MSMSLEATHAALRDLDTIIAKALGIREVARIARIESQMRQFILAQWQRLERRAVDQAVRRLAQSPEEVTNKDISAVIAVVNREMGKWSKRVKDRVLDDVEDIYILAREAGHRKASGKSRASLQYNTMPYSGARAAMRQAKLAQVKKAGPEISDIPDFDVVDEEAISALRRQQQFWIGQHYGQHVAAKVQDTFFRTILEQGRSRKKAGELLRRNLRNALGSVQSPDGFNGTARQYFEGVAANATTVARVQGQLRSFENLGFESYQIVNPLDERTCPTCGHMDGKQFTTAQGIDLVEKEIAAENPEEVKKVHPWIGTKAMLDISPKPGHVSTKDSDALAKAGFHLPPFHFLCRCTIDVLL